MKNANVVLYDNMLLGWDQETITADGKKLLTDTPQAIEAAKRIPEANPRSVTAGRHRVQLERVPDDV